MKKLTLLVAFIVSMVSIVSAKDPVPNKNYTLSLHRIILSVGDFKKTQYFVSADVRITENGKPNTIKYYRNGEFDVIDSRIMIGAGQMGSMTRMDSTLATEDEGGITPATYTIYIKFKKSNKCREKGTIEIPFVYDPTQDAYVIKTSFEVDGNKYTVDGCAVVQVSSETDSKFRQVGDIKIKNKDAPVR